MWASRAEQEDQLVDVTTKLFAAMMRTEDGSRLVRAALPTVFPWVRFLPAQDAEDFAQELVEIARAADALDNPAPLAQLITEWRHTAEVHADPVLHEILSRPSEDHGPVTEPRSAQ